MRKLLSSLIVVATLCMLTQCSLNGNKMETRIDKKNGNQVSLLGFGCMRFPVIEVEQNGEKSKKIDMEKSQQLVDYAIAHGVNYFDVAYRYHRGEAELAIGQLLKKYPRESYFLADKLPTWMISDLETAKKIFQEQLDKCQVEYFDYFLLHALSDKELYDKVYNKNEVYNYLLEEKAAGRIKNLGFSFHGNEEFFDYLLADKQWDFVQIQMNYMDWEDQNAKYLYDELAKREIPVIIMEPLQGSSLAKLNPEAEGILKTAEPDNSIASWAFRFVGSKPQVLTVLSGMTEMEHLVDNINVFTNFKPLTEEENQVLESAKTAFRKSKQIKCTGCHYCTPCPQGVDIPAVFAAYNKSVRENSLPDFENPNSNEFERRKEAFLENYNKIPEEARASKCTGCGQCVSKCPQSIQIPEKVKEIKELVEKLENKENK